MVVTSEQAFAAFRSLDVDGDGFLTKAAILGIEQSTETHDPAPDPIQEPEAQEEVIQEPEPVMEPVEEEVAPTPEPEANILIPSLFIVRLTALAVGQTFAP